MDRDVNAAINIKNWGKLELNRWGTHQIYACGETNDGEELVSSSYVSMKQENSLIVNKNNLLIIKEAAIL